MIMRLAETKVSGVDLKPSFRIGSSRPQATNDRGRNPVGQCEEDLPRGLA